ncbi:MAG: UDP-glucose/GDP-mannose dehydrogenase family protein [Verrucomicrobiales bacterium]|nr:UDP-glucose/GDP-mannose dehydrogenase family protein [Verrucomicrobiales bacterium]
MHISVFGLGYVGAVTAGCLAARGHHVRGVDVSSAKVEDLNRGKPPIIEPGLEERIATGLQTGRLNATTAADEAVKTTKVSLVCVGTPSTVSGSLDLTFVRQVTQQITEAVRAKKESHALVFRSTMLPGSTRSMVDEYARDLVDTGQLAVYYYPEFLREGSAVGDFDTPSLSVTGSIDGHPPSGNGELWFDPDTSAVSWETAEMLKYACNAFHATKVAFANEIGRLGKGLNVDATEVMRLLCRDTRLNVSPYYLRPGNPFGGSCLPKDVRALVHRARQAGASVPLLESLLPSNERHLQSLLEMIGASGHRELVILGLSFKSKTDDLRESAMVEVAQHCLGRGYGVRIFDPQLNLAALVGANKRLIDTRMPHLANLLHADLGQALGSRGLIVAAQQVVPAEELAKWLTSDHAILDVNGWTALRQLPCSYHGFCW